MSRVRVNLAGRTAVVTGGSRGVGHQIAQTLIDAGADVATVSRTGVRAGLSNRAKLSIRADLTRAEDVDRVVSEIGDGLGVPTILINAAGVYGPLQRVSDSRPGAWIETLHVNVVAPYLLCRAFVPGMLATGWGRVVNITSAASLHPPGPLNSAYTTSKVALNQFTRSLAAELAGTSVTANVLHPGDLKTDMWSDIDAQARELGPEAEPYRQWAEWVNRSGGDDVHKVGRAVLEIIDGDSNGEFHWIADPLQSPLPSWAALTEAHPWEG